MFLRRIDCIQLRIANTNKALWKLLEIIYSLNIKHLLTQFKVQDTEYIVNMVKIKYNERFVNFI